MFHNFLHRHGGAWHAGRRAAHDESPRGGRHHPDHGHHRGGGRTRDGSRIFDHGDLRFVIMALLSEQPRYGYDIIKALEERVGGGYSPSPGVIYPTLTLLEEIGHATIAEERGRKLYSLTEEGTAFLAGNRTVADAILARIDAGSVARRGPPPQVIRALENLNVAVRLRLKGQTVSDAQIQAVADAIDAAAKAVESI